MNLPHLRVLSLSLAALLLTHCATVPVPVAAPAVAAESKPKGPTEAERLSALYQREWEWRLEEYPELATVVGDRRYNDRLKDLSLEAIERRKAHHRALQTELRRFRPERLGPEDRLNFELFTRDVDEDVEGARFPFEVLAIDQFNGPQQALTEVAEDQPRLSRKDFEDYLKRLHAAPRYIDQTIALLRKGLEAGVVPPRPVLVRVSPVLKKHVGPDPLQSPLYTLVFKELPTWMSPHDGQTLRAEAVRILKGEVTPAFAKLQRFFEDEYLPKARPAVAWSTLPEGAAWYAYLVKVHTTTEQKPEEIHQIGLNEVQRIRGEMERARKEMGFKGTLPDLFRYLRSDSKFFYKDAESLLAAYRDIAKRLDPQLLKLFGKLPRLPYGISPVPEHSAPGLPAAYYSRGSVEGGRAGTFFANTYDLRARPKWEMESLALHEAVPGHHLQIALAQEQDTLPLFRRYSQYTAFVEGWGLYSESLGADLGIYKDPYSRMGRLINEMWRAIRLVVDTGLHTKGWTREQAIAYFEENAGRASTDVAVEVDRYIAWAGQALAYKTGELKLQALRKKSKEALGDRFDVRAFHDLLLKDGGLPLALLERRVDEWIEAQGPAKRAAAAAAPSSRTE